MLEKFLNKANDEIQDNNPQELYIVRTQNAGVFFGEIAELNEKTRRCTMKNARRIWYWDGAASLSQLSVDGVSKPENCKFPCEVEEVVLFEVIEILKLSVKAKKSLKSVLVWSK